MTKGIFCDMTALGILKTTPAFASRWSAKNRMPKGKATVKICLYPLIVTDHLDEWDAFVAAWLPGTEGQGVADVLFGDRPFSGKLPYTWPRSVDQLPLSALAESGQEPLFPFGYGLTTDGSEAAKPPD